MNENTVPFEDMYFPDEKMRPTLCKMLRACEEAGLTLYQLEWMADLFKKAVKKQIHGQKVSTEFVFVEILDD